MDIEGIAFVVLVAGGLTCFGVVLAFVTWWSERPRSDQIADAPAGHEMPPPAVHPTTSFGAP